MIDLHLKEGDIVFDGDVALTNDKSRDVKRAIITPLGWIGRDTVDGPLHTSYGNRIYRLLSEPLTRTWIADARDATNSALSFVESGARVLDINVLVDDYERITIPITYSSEGDANTVEISL